MTGTAIAQLITYLIYPILTRIYSTSDIGELGVYTRLVAFIAAFATARYELTLPIAKQDHHAFLLYRLSFRISLIVLSSILLLGFIFYLLKPFDLSNYVFLLIVVVSSYIMVWINLGTSWSIRKKLFHQVSRQRVVNSVSVNGLRLFFGLANFGAFGLILGSLLGSFASIFVFIRTFLSDLKIYRPTKDLKRFRILAKEYKSFPLINLPHTLLDLGIDLLIAFFIVLFYDKDVFGSFSHAYMMLRLPLLFFGQSIGQVFFNKCSDMINKGQDIYPLVKKTTRTLFLIAVVPFTVLFFYGVPIFKFIFGDQWEESGRIAEILAPALVLNFLISPISTLALILSKQKAMFGIGIIVAFIHCFCFGVLPLLFSGLMRLRVLSINFHSFEFILVVNTILLSIVYVIVLKMYLNFAKNRITLN
ncbi:lipopolysaccharide biosynthesis protein [Fluviicola taffensis]|nr:oligosaccharide flippase family protein [Fluviicola taffensis]